MEFWRLGSMYESIIAACKAMDTFGLPRAVGNLETDCFIFGNDSFSRVAGLKEEESSTVSLSDFLRIKLDPYNPPKTGQLIPIAIQSRDQGFIIRGHASVRDDGLIYLMLPLFGDPSSDFELGRSVGKEQERQKLSRHVGEQLTPELLSVITSVESLRSELNKENDAAEATLKEIEQSLSRVLQFFNERF